MGNELLRRIRNLFRSRDEASIELVMYGNGFAAILVAGVAAFSGLTLPLAAGLVPLVFVILAACLLSRYTVWIAGLLGSVAMALSLAVLLAGALADKVPHGSWIGASLGGLGGFSIGFAIYYKVARHASRKSEQRSR